MESQEFKAPFVGSADESSCDDEFGENGIETESYSTKDDFYIDDCKRQKLEEIESDTVSQEEFQESEDSQDVEEDLTSKLLLSIQVLFICQFLLFVSMSQLHQ